MSKFCVKPFLIDHFSETTLQIRSIFDSYISTALLAVPRRLFCFGSLVILDVARCYLWLFTLYINIKIGKIVVKC